MNKLFEIENKKNDLVMRKAKPIQKEHRHLVVHFDCKKDLNDFAKLIGMPISERDKELYYDMDATTSTVLVALQETDVCKKQPKQEWEYWWGMPEYISYDKQGYHMIYVYFKNEKSKAHFIELVGQNITKTTKYIWFPEKEKLSRLAYTWVVE